MNDTTVGSGAGYGGMGGNACCIDCTPGAVYGTNKLETLEKGSGGGPGTSGPGSGGMKITSLLISRFWWRCNQSHTRRRLFCN
jgi:hypothetical protein